MRCVLWRFKLSGILLLMLSVFPQSSPVNFHLASLKTTDRVWDAVRLMLTRHVSSVAVFNEEKNYFDGFVDVSDISTIIFMLNFAKELSGALANEPTWSKFAQTELKVLEKSTVAEMVNVSGRDPWQEVAFHATGRALLQCLVPRAARRVAVKDAGNAGLEGVVSQWDAVRFLQRQLTHRHWFATTPFASIVPSSMQQSRISQKLISISESSSAFEAFTAITEQNVSGAAVVDSSGRLVGVLSASDFLRSRRDDTGHNFDGFFDDLKSPLTEYLNLRNRYFPGEYSRHPITIDPKKDAVMDVLQKFTSNHVHRLFVVDEKNRPVGVWSLGDIIELFLRYNGPAAADKKKKKKKAKDDKKKKKKNDKKSSSKK